MTTFKRLLSLLISATIVSHATIFAQTAGTADKVAIAEGVALLRAGQAAQAKLQFDAAIIAAPRSPDAYTWRGLAEDQLAQYAAAVEDFKAALRINPSLTTAHYNLALTYIRQHQTDAAIEQLRMVTTAEPRVVQPRYNLAILLESKGSIDEALSELNAAHTIDPKDKGVALHLLIDELKQKKPIQPASLIDELADASTPASLQQQSGAALIEAGRFNSAVAVLKSAWQREPTLPGLSTLLARAYIGDQKQTQAIALLESTAPDQKTNEANYLLGLAYTDKGEDTKATQSFEAAAHLDPNDARPLYRLGLLAATSPDKQSTAADYLRSAHRLDPANSVYTLALARVLLITNQAEDAKTLLATVQPEGPAAAQIDALKGLAAAATHGIEEAIPLLRKAVAEDPSLALAHNVLGFCLFQQGHYAEAALAYGTASTLDPKRLLYARDSAVAFERANQPAQALHFAEQANALPDADANDHLLLGKLYAASARRPEAIRELERAATLNPNLDAACYLLARTYMRMGNRQQAAVWNDKLTSLKQREAADLTVQKKSLSIRSSTLLQGGSLSADDPGTP